MGNRYVSFRAVVTAAATTLVAVAIPLAAMAAWSSDTATPPTEEVALSSVAALEQAVPELDPVEEFVLDSAHGHLVVATLPSGFYLADQRGPDGPGGVPKSYMSVFFRGADPDDEDWAIIRVVWIPGESFDVASWVYLKSGPEEEGSRSVTSTSVRGLPAVAEIADPSSPDDGVKVLRFVDMGGIVRIVGNGPVTIEDLKAVAEGLELKGGAS